VELKVTIWEIGNLATKMSKNVAFQENRPFSWTKSGQIGRKIVTITLTPGLLKKVISGVVINIGLVSAQLAAVHDHDGVGAVAAGGLAGAAHRRLLGRPRQEPPDPDSEGLARKRPVMASGEVLRVFSSFLCSLFPGPMFVV
jgi:hypothetical protein